MIGKITLNKLNFYYKNLIDLVCLSFENLGKVILLLLFGLNRLLNWILFFMINFKNFCKCSEFNMTNIKKF